MKKLKEKRMLRIAMVACGILALIVTICAFINPIAAIGAPLAAIGLMIGGIELTPDQEKAWGAMMDEINKEVDKRQKGYISETKASELINKHMDEFKALMGDKEIDLKNVKGLQDQLDLLGKDINALKESGLSNEAKVALAIQLKEQAANIDKEMSGMNGKFSLKVKVSDFIPKATILPAAIASNTNGMRLPGFGQIATIRRRIADLFTKFSMEADSNGVIYYTDTTTATRNAASRTVGDAAAESVLAWTVYNKTLESISDSIPVAKEMLTRVSLMEAEIRNFITNNLLLKEDSLLISGTGSSPQLKGVYTYATAFDSAAYTGFHPKAAALMDLIIIMATEIEKNTQYMVDTVILNPSDALGLILEKSEDGYRMNIQMMNATGEMSIRNIKIIQSASQTINTLTIGDFTKARLYYGEDITLEFGYNASGDFAKRIVTMLGNMERLLLIRECENNAFLKSTSITTDLGNVTEVLA
jgi:hypothetical protein